MKRSSNPVQKELKDFVINQFAKLMTTCVILKMDDFTLYKVTTSGKKQSLKEFITGMCFLNILLHFVYAVIVVLIIMLCNLVS